MDVSGGSSSGGKRQHSRLVVDVPPHGQLRAVTGEDAPVTPSKSPRVELGTSGASGGDTDVVARQVWVHLVRVLEIPAGIQEAVP